MANEAAIINNPTSTPAAVSTGYQRQNTKAEAQQNGIDLTYVESGIGECVLKISGPVDVNGVLYSIASDVTFSTFAGGAGNYIIYLAGSGDNLTPTITQTPGDFDASKNAHYTTGQRILNWLITYDGTNAVAKKIDEESAEKTVITANGTWTAMFTKVYEFICIGKGGNGGSATYASGYAMGTGGGSGAIGIIRKYIEAGDVWTATFSAASGGNCTFDDGVTTLTFQNGYDGVNTTNTQFAQGGAGGMTLTGFDQDLTGQRGFSNAGITSHGADPCLYGVGGADGKNIGGTANTAGGAGSGYGSGGGGGYRISGGTSGGGAGATAAIIITG